MPSPTRILATIVALVPMLGCTADIRRQLPQPVTLNADEYRKDISDLDRLVFSPKAYDNAHRAELAVKLENLAARVTTGSDSRFLKMEADEIRILAALAQHASSGPGRDHLQENWMRIRNNLFEDRSWMARSAADLNQESEE